MGSTLEKYIYKKNWILLNKYEKNKVVYDGSNSNNTQNICVCQLLLQNIKYDMH